MKNITIKYIQYGIIFLLIIFLIMSIAFLAKDHLVKESEWEIITNNEESEVDPDFPSYHIDNPLIPTGWPEVY